MQAAVRTRYNHALEYAIHLANHRSVPLHVFFVLTPNYPGASQRHYRFLVEGLRDVNRNLQHRGIPFSLLRGEPPEVALTQAASASTLVVDRGYTRIQRGWYGILADRSPCPVVQVETNVVVPVGLVSGKEEYSAATIRPKILRHREEFLQPVEPVDYHGVKTKSAATTATPPLEVPAAEVESLAQQPGTTPFVGGEDEAAGTLAGFLEHRLRDYGDLRNIPDRDWTSRLSPYLHFGMISPVEIALRTIEHAQLFLTPEADGSVDTLLEELIVRRELAMNFTEYNDHYLSFSCLPDWAQRTLRDHSGDDRPHLYSHRQLENAETHDPYWNACQRQMVETGLMHGYMRMYWGKKIIEWTQDPEEAYLRAIDLNDRYELDGRDPNGYAGVAWCFGKHDRGWAERPVFGKVRYMNDRGLQRKFKEIDRYVRRWCGPEDDPGDG
jgi:deoxyribodipyrimidine photo-lyase